MRRNLSLPDGHDGFTAHDESIELRIERGVQSTIFVGDNFEAAPFFGEVMVQISASTPGGRVQISALHLTQGSLLDLHRYLLAEDKSELEEGETWVSKPTLATTALAMLAALLAGCGLSMRQNVDGAAPPKKAQVQNKRSAATELALQAELLEKTPPPTLPPQLQKQKTSSKRRDSSEAVLEQHRRERRRQADARRRADG